MSYTAKAEVLINASTTKVWEALTNPEVIKQWLFGTEVTTDWHVGSSIVYKGMWEGKAYEDKGTIIRIQPERVLETTYWSSFSGKLDVPENYQKVIYELERQDQATKITITQDNVPTEESAKHSEQNWQTVLGKMKEVLEKQN